MGEDASEHFIRISFLAYWLTRIASVREIPPPPHASACPIQVTTHVFTVCSLYPVNYWHLTIFIDYLLIF
jgi:hypothetical protein